MSKRTVLVVLALAAVAAVAQVHEHAAPPAPVAAGAASGVAALSPEVRALLRQEMAALQGAMLELVPALVAGDWATIAEIAQRIRAGFILSRELTPAQREQLATRLPVGFLELDAEFHGLADGLAAAARERSQELVTFYVYKLQDSCVGCHSRHARERFPAFAPGHAPAAAHAH
jgi:hypothetical protein